MKVIKRNETEVSFDINKIRNAIEKASDNTLSSEHISEDKLEEIVNAVVNDINKLGLSTISVESIQDIVENKIIDAGFVTIGKEYIKYRYEHELARNESDFDKKVLAIIDGENEIAKQENSNKNPVIVSTQRDYMAGEVSKRLVDKYFMDPDIIDANNKGLIHLHDKDYISQRIHNCCVFDLEDMLQNGTVISGTKIDTPKSFSTACNITTQIVAQIASSQLGGQTFSLAHLAPFVDVSRKKIEALVRDEISLIGKELSEEEIKKIVDFRLRQEIKTGVQMIQYQIVTLMTTNGQSPFVSVFMYLNEAKDEQTKEDLALVIEEVLRQRYKGTKNEMGVWVTPAFPKLLYVLEEDNIHEDSKYWYLTELAAKCTAKRMVPDYISEKIMKELKEGNCYPCIN